MKAKSANQLKIKLKENDADNFKSALQKISGELKSIGFKRSDLTKDEISVIHQLSEKINDL